MDHWQSVAGVSNIMADDDDIPMVVYDDSYEKRYGRKRQEGDDDISPWKFYGAIVLVILMIAAMLATVMMT
jgi:hypothetical protein